MLPVLYFLLKYHTKDEAMDQKLWSRISTGNKGHICVLDVKKGHKGPCKVEKKDLEINTIESDSVTVNQRWVDTLECVFIQGWHCE